MTAGGAAGVVVTPSSYTYKVQATNNVWTGPFSTVASFLEGVWQIP